jgi:hypothetical protein
MTQAFDQLPLFELVPDETALPDEVSSPAPYLNGCVESGLYVPTNELGRHLRSTYTALSQLALASRGRAATTHYGVVQCITEKRATGLPPT